MKLNTRFVCNERGPVQAVFTRTDFSKVSSTYRFSAAIADNWKVEYLPQIQSINVYDPGSSGKDTLEKSLIFIRFFEASEFLTLSTVQIFDRQETTVNGHMAVAYDIEKKTGVTDFPHQPSWRNQRHQLTDIRFANEGRTFFMCLLIIRLCLARHLRHSLLH